MLDGTIREGPISVATQKSPRGKKLLADTLLHYGGFCLRLDTIPQTVFLSDLFAKPLVATFGQQCASSDGGAVLLEAAKARYDLMDGFARWLVDDRQPWRVRHALRDPLGRPLFRVARDHPGASDPDRLAEHQIHKLLLAPDPVARDVGRRWSPASPTRGRRSCSSGPTGLTSPRPSGAPSVSRDGVAARTPAISRLETHIQARRSRTYETPWTQPTASQPTISRFENDVGVQELYVIGRHVAASVIDQHQRRLLRRSRRITIDLNSTDRKRATRARISGQLDNDYFRIQVLSIVPKKRSPY